MAAGPTQPEQPLLASSSATARMACRRCPMMPRDTLVAHPAIQISARGGARHASTSSCNGCLHNSPTFALPLPDAVDAVSFNEIAINTFFIPEMRIQSDNTSSGKVQDPIQNATDFQLRSGKVIPKAPPLGRCMIQRLAIISLRSMDVPPDFKR